MERTDLINKVTELSFKLRSKREFDRAVGLELLTEAFLSRREVCLYTSSPYNRLEKRSLKEPEAVLSLLLTLENTDRRGTDMSQQTWAALRMLHRLRGNHSSYLPSPPKDPVYRGYDVVRMVREKQDVFGLGDGPLGCEEEGRRYGDSRFDEGVVGITLQTYGDLDPIESLRTGKPDKRPVSKFFEKGEMPENSPFGFPIFLPPLGSLPEELLPIHSTPPQYHSQPTPQVSPTPALPKSKPVTWLDLVDELHSQGPKFFQIDPKARRNVLLWESESGVQDYHGTAQMRDSKDYERLYLRSVDTFGRGKR